MRRSVTQKFIATVLIAIFSLTLQLSLLTVPQQANAQYAVNDAQLNATSLLSYAKEVVAAAGSILSAQSLTSLNIKETILDPIAWFAAKAVVRAMTRSIINWINNGFEGSPMFVTNPEAFFLDLIDKEIGDFIYGSQLGFLCEPFQLQIKIALATRYGRDEKQFACRLSQVGTNLDNFFNGLAGSFQSAGGWKTWFTVVSEENPYNRYLEAQRLLDSRIADEINAVNRAPIAKLEWNSGFFSFEECRTIGEGHQGLTSDDTGAAEYTSDDTGNSAAGTDCEIKTPGAFIVDQLNRVSGASVDALVSADEINEIIDALFSQLVVQALGGGAGGLRGLSQSQTGSSSYLDRLVNQPVVSNDILGNFNESNPNIIQEQNFKLQAQEIINRVQRTETTLLSVPACAAASAASIVTTRTTPLKAEYQKLVSEADQNITLLRGLENSLGVATSSEAVLQANQQTTALLASGKLHDITELAELQNKKSSVDSEMIRTETQIAAQVTACLAAETAVNNQGGN